MNRYYSLINNSTEGRYWGEGAVAGMLVNGTHVLLMIAGLSSFINNVNFPVKM